MPKDIKLFTLAKELNVGIGSFKESLEKKDVLDVNTINPNTRVPRQIAEQLIAEHGRGMGKAEISQLLDKLDGSAATPKTEPAKPKEEPKPESRPAKETHIETVIPEDRRPSLNIKGSIADLKPKAEVKPEPKVEVKPEPKPEPKVTPAPNPQPEAKPAEAPAPAKVEEPKPAKPEVKTEPTPKPEPKVEVKPEPTPAPEAKAPEKEEPTVREPEIYRPSAPSAGISFNVVGKIDLSTINDNTRPAKKAHGDKSGRKRTRIGKGPVDVKAEAAKVTDNAPKKQGQRTGGANGTGRSADPNSRGANRNAQSAGDGQKTGRKAKRQSQQPQKAVVTDEDVQRQVKETLARLTGKNQQGAKSAKHRRDKRDAARSAALDAQERSEAESRTLKLTEFVTVSDLASMMDVPVTQVIATCMSIGLMVSINMRLDAETIDMVAEEFGYKTDFVSAEVVEAMTQEDEVDDEADLISRPPIVTVMGHVDHGKTSLLDRLRNTNVIAGEAGGITQHIGAYSLRLKDGKRITFLDTPGHEAFTAMRARGAKVTDIAIIIVAADDDVMPQTKEAINHAAAAGVPMVFAINKIDKPAANPDRIREQLAAMNYLVEEWGGKYQCQEISAKKGINIDELLEKVLLEAELLELKANPKRRAVGSVIESSLDKGRGYVATVLVQNGTLSQGDIVLSGTHYGRVKAMFNERNQKVEKAGPSEPVLILGLDGAPTAGETFNVMDTEQEARSIASKREQLKREQDNRTKKGLTLDELARRRALGNFQELNVIIKGDVDGSIEALSDSLIRLSTEEIQVNVIHKGVGQISESDVVLASASSAIILGFQVRPSQAARRLADREGVEIRTYSIIYDTIEDIKSAMEGMLSPEIKENVVANLEVQQTFKITKVGTIAGCMVVEGKIKRNNKIRLIRDGIVKYQGELGSLKRYKDDAKEVVMGQDCGLNIDGYNDIMVGDIIEAYEEIEIKKTLD
ncbi:translation initiation factor IF-2 [Porphyromonas sp. oral taxon 278 str. W7784]|uniref:translation initiation factor IF-2 n=1 Tax=Porphyromonas sp. oral taxon 278 TaxID=712437 RepID=UPI0003AD0799|nr:translation initiation factor IF-2 [Porphyromonas sp. oral taxon 278]ERJ72826.1 translation initiation factor IF-2 [Porphyromonas sp. oral taxon 278 str. W7784]